MGNDVRSPGRPSGRKKTAKIEVVLEPSVKEAFMELIAKQGTSASVEIGRWVKEYIKQSEGNL